MSGMDSDVEEFLNQANSTVAAVADKGRVAAAILPKYQLQPTTKYVARHSIDYVDESVDDISTIPLSEISVRFAVDWQQLSAPNVQTALGLARLAGQTYSRLEDRLLFLGQYID